MRPQRIIVRTPNYIGDTIMMLPALELVRMEYPQAEITIVCKAHSKDIFRGSGVEKVIVDNTKGKNRLAKIFALVKTLREKSYDEGFLFHNSFLTALIFRLAKVKRLIGYNKESRKIFLNYSLSMDRNWHYVNQYANLVNQYLGNKYDKLPLMKLHASSSQKTRKKAGKPLIGFVLGGDNKGKRKYPRDLSLELFSLLANEPFEFVLLGDKNDAENHSAYAELLKSSGSQVFDLTGKTTVGEFIDAINTLDLLVTIDSSAMHIAAATETEFILLTGKGTSPLSVVFPKQGRGHIIERGQHCVRGEDMMSAISPKDIYEKIIQVANKKVIFGDESFSKREDYGIKNQE